MAMEFAEAVNRLLEELRRRMIDAVSGAELRGILEPKIRRQIHHLDAGLDQLGGMGGADRFGQA